MIPNEMPMLSHGGHISAQSGTCVMEYISLIMGYEFTMAPVCTDRDVARYAYSANDGMFEDARQRLLALVPRLSAAAPLVPHRPKNSEDEELLAWAEDYHERRVERNIRLVTAWNSVFPEDAWGEDLQQYADIDVPLVLDSPKMPGQRYLDDGDERIDDVYYRALEAVLDEHERIAAEWGIEMACPVEIPQVILDLVESER